MIASLEKINFYRDEAIVDNPWPCFEYLRSQGPIPPLPFSSKGDVVTEQVEEHRREFPFGEEIVPFAGVRRDAMRILGIPDVALDQFREWMGNFVIETADEDEKAVLGGVEREPATVLMTCYMATNHDPRFYDNPNEFIMGRPKVKGHVTFGRGVNPCPGAPLPQVGGRISIEKWFERFSDISLMMQNTAH